MGPSEVDVIVLCGGLGTRLRRVSGEVQKTMVEIKGKPFLEIVYDHARSYGFQNFIFCTGYKGDDVKTYFSEKNKNIIFSQEREPLGTAGALKNSAPFIQNDTLLVLNGDSFCSVDLRDLLDFHVRSGGKATLCVVPARSRTDGGYIKTNEKNQILSFREKEYQPGLYINAGVYAFKRRILDRIPEGRASLENDVFPFLSEREAYAYIASEILHDIGTPDRLNAFIMEGA